MSLVVLIQYTMDGITINTRAPRKDNTQTDPTPTPPNACRGVNALVETIAFFLSADDPRAAAFIMNVAHHMTNLVMLTDACGLHSLEVELMPLGAFVPGDQLNEFPNAYMARISRRSEDRVLLG